MGISISLCFSVVAFPHDSPISSFGIVRVVTSINYYIIRLRQARVKCLRKEKPHHEGVGFSFYVNMWACGLGSKSIFQFMPHKLIVSIIPHIHLPLSIFGE